MYVREAIPLITGLNTTMRQALASCWDCCLHVVSEVCSSDGVIEIDLCVHAVNFGWLQVTAKREREALLYKKVIILVLKKKTVVTNTLLISYSTWLSFLIGDRCCTGPS